jgi:hypothetical protein
VKNICHGVPRPYSRYRISQLKDLFSGSNIRIGNCIKIMEKRL